MAVIEFPDQVSRLLARPDFRDLSADVSIRVAQGLSVAFQVEKAGGILLHPGCDANAVSAALAVRHALELLLLQRLWPALPVLAGLAAARTAALFALGERPDGGGAEDANAGLAGQAYAALAAADAPPSPAQLRTLWAALACHQPGLDAALPSGVSGMLSRVWPVLGPAEWLMQPGVRPQSRARSGGDGCRLRPRPFVTSFASASGCSISERGYSGAEALRQGLLAQSAGNAAAAGNALANVRGVIRTAWGLPPGTFVALAATSAEAEMVALAAAQGHPDGRPVTMVLMAPAEIDDGVAVAASGRHPAAVTARGVAVRPLGPIEGFRGDTEVRTVALRDGNGATRAAKEIGAECDGIAASAVAAGRRVVLHRIDTSRTGLLAPDVMTLMAIKERHPERVDVVVDASQARLAPDRVWEYLALGWIVMLSGSRFLTGPSSSAAVLVPETLRDRFACKLPLGLRDYCGRAEWPPSLTAASALPPGGDVGLALRWAAGLAELNAFHGASPGEQHRVMSDFGERIRSAIAGNPDLLLVEAPPPRRPAGWVPAELAWNGTVREGEGWDETQTIISFAMRDPGGSGWLSPVGAWQVHDQLRANPNAAPPGDAAGHQRSAPRRAFEVGQPVTVPKGGDVGVLSIAASTRLVSTGPSDAAANPDERLTRAVLDAEAVIEEVAHILRRWPSPDSSAGDGASD